MKTIKELIAFLAKVETDWTNLDKDKKEEYFWDSGTLGFLEKYPEYNALLEDLSDEEIETLNNYLCDHLYDTYMGEVDEEEGE